MRASANSRPRATTASGARSGRFRRAITACGLALVVAAGLGSASHTASAYYNTSSSGSIGPISWGSGGGAQVGLPNYTVRTPIMIVRNNGYLRTRLQQEITVYHVLERWSVNAWNPVGYVKAVAWTSIGSDGAAVVLSSNVASHQRMAGYFRIQTFVIWGSQMSPLGPTGVVTGAQSYVPSTTADVRCASTRCAVYPGSLYLAG